MGPFDLNFGGGFSPLGSSSGVDLLAGAGGLLGELNPFPEFLGDGFSGYNFPDFSLFQSASFRLPTLFSFDSPPLQMPGFFQPNWYGFGGASYFGGFAPSFRFIAHGTDRSNSSAEDAPAKDSPVDLPSGGDSETNPAAVTSATPPEDVNPPAVSVPPPVEPSTTSEATTPVEPVAPAGGVTIPTEPLPTPPVPPTSPPPEDTTSPIPAPPSPAPVMPVEEASAAPLAPTSSPEKAEGMTFDEIAFMNTPEETPVPTTTEIIQLENDLKKSNLKIKKEKTQYAAAMNKAYKAAGYHFEIPKKVLDWCRENNIDPKKATDIFSEWHSVDLHSLKVARLEKKLNNLGLSWNDKPDLGIVAIFPKLPKANHNQIITLGREMYSIYRVTLEPDEIEAVPFLPEQKQKAQNLHEKVLRYFIAIDKMRQILSQMPPAEEITALAETLPTPPTPSAAVAPMEAPLPIAPLPSPPATDAEEPLEFELDELGETAEESAPTAVSATETETTPPVKPAPEEEQFNILRQYITIKTDLEERGLWTNLSNEAFKDWNDPFDLDNLILAAKRMKTLQLDPPKRSYNLPTNQRHQRQYDEFHRVKNRLVSLLPKLENRLKVLLEKQTRTLDTNPDIILSKAKDSTETMKVGDITFKRSEKMEPHFKGDKEHTFVLLSEKATPAQIEEALLPYTQKGNKEDAWIYVSYREGDRERKVLFEVGEKEEENGVRYSVDFLKNFTKKSGVALREAFIYHQHPEVTDEPLAFYLISPQDIESSLIEMARSRKEGISDALHYRIVTPMGVYSLSPYSEKGSAKAVAKTLASTYKKWVLNKNNAVTYHQTASWISKTKGVHCSFEYFNPLMKEVADTYTQFIGSNNGKDLNLSQMNENQLRQLDRLVARLGQAVRFTQKTGPSNSFLKKVVEEGEKWANIVNQFHENRVATARVVPQA